MASADLCVIFNPAAGKHRAAERLEALQRQWGKTIKFMPTQRAGQATDLAEAAARSGISLVAAAGGDGTVHEVANGILRAGRPEVHFAVIPLGSANDYAHSLDWEFAQPPTASAGFQAQHENGRPSANGCRALDVGRVSTSSGRERYFVCCLGLGLNGAVTLESRRIHRLQGVALYGLATLRALWYHYGCPPMELTLDEEATWTTPTLMLSLLLGRREGGFVLAPRARLDDGWFDYVHAGALSRWEVVKLLPRLAASGPPADYPKVRQGRCHAVNVRAQTPLTVHIDGEFFCTPQDNVRDLEIRVLPRALTVERMVQ